MILEEARIRRATNDIDPESSEFDASSSPSSTKRSLTTFSSRDTLRTPLSTPYLRRVTTSSSSSTSPLGVPTAVVFSPKDSKIPDSNKDSFFNAMLESKRTQAQSNLQSWLSKNWKGSRSKKETSPRMDSFWSEEEMEDLRGKVTTVVLKSPSLSL
ncbi:hypothetical protein BDY24DRAFT_21340 [Mrakia frigida]|uniref:uncharacterized protein n=1 Tax=Mrakia frigida TaxID=29902 RepID=UPI003FCC22AE